ncbi:MAG: biotin/lipoyl-binding protein, partial [Deltaproteobacteria bacterium]|nr:biotin/lipoyl-binding protein [Deltaproteobacteria bacterium]
MKKIIILLIIATVLISAWFFIFNRNNSAVKYKTAKIERGSIESSISATGTLNAVTTVLVGSQVSGTVKEIYADFNSIVKKNQVIALIDDAPFIAKVKQAQANLESSKAGIENAKAGIENLKALVLSGKADVDKARFAVNDAKRNLVRIKGLWEKELASQKDMDNAQFTFDSQNAQLKGAEALYDSRLAQLNVQEAQHKA